LHYQQQVQQYYQLCFSQQEHTYFFKEQSMLSNEQINNLNQLDYDQVIEVAKQYIPEQYLSYVNDPEDINKILRKLEQEE
jgi:hypothetical protein